MSSDEENLFYEVLRKNFSPLFQEKSQGGNYMFCLPPNHATRFILKQFGTNQKKMLYFINSHFLRISSYYKDHYVSLYGNTFLKKKNLLVTRTGFSKRFSVNITREENYLTEKFEEYKVWFLDRCLLEEGEEIEYLAKRVKKEHSSMKTLASLEEMQKRLCQVNKKVFGNLMKKIVGFNKSYVLMKSCENQAIEKLNQYFRILLQQYDEQTINSLEIKICIRSVLESGVYKRLITFFKKSSFKKDDLKFYKTCSSLLKLKSQTELGVPEIYICKHDEAIETLLKIGNFTTVIEKMRCIKRTLEIITESITKQKEKDDGENAATLDIFKVRKVEKKVVLLTSDEVIAILSYVIISAKIPDIMSNFHFIEKCQIQELKTTHYHYSFLNFSAAIEYILKLGEEEKEKRKVLKASKKKHNNKGNIDNLDYFTL